MPPKPSKADAAAGAAPAAACNQFFPLYEQAINAHQGITHNRKKTIIDILRIKFSTASAVSYKIGDVDKLIIQPLKQSKDFPNTAELNIIKDISTAIRNNERSKGDKTAPRRATAKSAFNGGKGVVEGHLPELTGLQSRITILIDARLKKLPENVSEARKYLSDTLRLVEQINLAILDSQHGESTVKVAEQIIAGYYRPQNLTEEQIQKRKKAILN